MALRLLTPWGFSRVCKRNYAQVLRLLWSGEVQRRVSPPSVHCSLFITHMGRLSAAASPSGSSAHSLAHTETEERMKKQREVRGGSWRSFPVWKIVLKLKNGKLQSSTGKSLRRYQKMRLSSFFGSLEFNTALLSSCQMHQKYLTLH